MRTRSSTVAVAAVVVATLALVGCGSDDSDGAAAAPKGCRKVEGGAFTITAENMAYTDACLEVVAGAYDISFVNDDEGTGHNLHITGDGGFDARTDLTVGPDRHELPDVDLTVPGTYRFVCDPHSNMVGTITVVPPPAATTTSAATTSADPAPSTTVAP